MRIAAAAFALVLACGACAGKYTPGQPYDAPDGSITPVGGGGGGSDGGDAGSDAGFDAGSDGGCTALSANGVSYVDGCIASGVAATASISVTPPGCTALITLSSGTSCNGVALGPLDAFDGGCTGFPACSSTSLPGTIHCGSCSIVLCDGGPCP
ncbi:MAG: hypothetical protein E6J78_05185 [Deltaproteobacteria bacterium]|nr:MAG: hypothetical protein E6J78_05185 [Deltaproteobacteria bacterium]